MDIGSRVKEQRAKIGISQSKLASEIGVTVDMIRSIEINRARPSIETLAKLSMFFGCTADYLLGNSNNPLFSAGKDMSKDLEFIKELTPEQKDSLIASLLSALDGHIDKGNS